MGEAVKIDILSSRIDVAGEMEFTASGAVAEVAMLPPVDRNIDFVDNQAGVRRFESGDNVFLKKIWWNIPHGFRQGSGTARVCLLWKNAIGTVDLITGLPQPSALNFPDVCAGLEFPGNGLFIRTPTTLGPVGIVLAGVPLGAPTQLNVSMANLPAILDGLLLKVQVHLLLLHTKDLI
jgi:hypothetical protein